MNIIKKLILVNVISVVGVMGIAGAMPVFAQTADQNALMDRMRQARELFRERRDAAVDARPEDRVVRERDRRDARRDYLRDIINAVERRNADLRQRVLDNRRIYQQRADDIRAEADAFTTRIHDLRTRVQDAQDETELRVIGVELRADYQAHQDIIRKRVILDQIASFKREAVSTAQLRSQNIARVIAILKDKGEQIGGMEVLLAQADAKIADANSKLDQLTHDVEQGDLTDVKLGEIRDAMNSIRGQIRAVYAIFGQIATQK